MKIILFLNFIKFPKKRWKFICTMYECLKNVIERGLIVHSNKFRRKNFFLLKYSYAHRFSYYKLGIFHFNFNWNNTRVIWIFEDLVLDADVCGWNELQRYLSERQGHWTKNYPVKLKSPCKKPQLQLNYDNGAIDNLAEMKIWKYKSAKVNDLTQMLTTYSICYLDDKLDLIEFPKCESW